MEDKKNKKHILYNIFNPSRDAKEAENEKDVPRNFKYFFRLLGRNITNILYLNLLIVFGNFPVWFGVYALTGNLNTASSVMPSSPLAANLYGAVTSGGAHTPVLSNLLGVFGTGTTVSVTSTATQVFSLLTLLVIFTFGIVMTGTSYIMRNIVRGEPVFFMHDFKHAIKRNLRQSIILGIIDVIISFLLIYNIVIMSASPSGMLLLVLNLVIGFEYVQMRFYMYILLVTFDLSIWKILKNSLIFALIGTKRNLPAFFGVVIVAGFSFILTMAYMPIGIILVLAFSFALCRFMGIYAAWPKIKQIMIDPYEAGNGQTLEAPLQ